MSDKVFFGEDYPDNEAPKGKVDPELGQPYPALQDPNHFDTDYVKDENTDDGEWKSQMEYDLLRAKAKQNKDLVEKTKATEEELKEAVEKAKTYETIAAKKAQEAAQRAAKARGEAKKALEDAGKAKEATDEATDEQKQGAKTEAAGEQKEAESDVAASSSKKESNKVAKATEKVKKEMEDLDNCQKELSDARARLKELMETEKELARKRMEQQKGDKTQRDEELARLKKEESAASSVLSESEQDTTKLREDEQVHKDRLSKQEASHHVAEQRYKKEATDLENLQSELKAAEKKLREFRQGAAGSGDSEKPAEQTRLLAGRSGAAQHGTFVALTALIVVMFMCPISSTTSRARVSFPRRPMPSSRLSSRSSCPTPASR